MTREEWLNKFIAHPVTRDVFAEAGAALPDNIRVSIGFTSSKRAIGQCWSAENSKDGHFEIFITPELDTASQIADVLTHELVHAAVGVEAKHGRRFSEIARAVGLTGKMTATVAGDDWHVWADGVLADIGPFPGAQLTPDAASSGPKKQTTRYIKCQCDTCGIVFRAARANIEKASQHSGGMRCIDPVCAGTVRAERVE